MNQLNLNHITTTTPLVMKSCAFPEPITCTNARLRELNLSESALAGLHADGLHVDGDLFMRRSTVRGNDETGALVLRGAHISGQLVLIGARITNGSGPALNADTLHAKGGLFLASAELRGNGEDGTLRLKCAHISGQLDLDNAKVRNDSGPLLVLVETQVTEVLTLPTTVVCPTGGDWTWQGPCAENARQAQLQRLEFPRLARASWEEWLHLLVHHTKNYEPQPYQKLAAIERTSGHEKNAREILIVQQDELHRRTPKALGGWWAQLRHRFWGCVGRYGYRAHRLLFALLFLLILAGCTAYAAGQVPTGSGHYAAERTSLTSTHPEGQGSRCSTVELIGLGIDRGLPLGATGLRARCDLDTAVGWGKGFTLALWVLQALVWAFATLALAAYTGLIRKPA
ncbi:hypothetical protein LV78_000336 [Actinosynnema pretiosum]|nr:hypothetical protein [Actinosynnema pretiosum]